MFAGPGAPAELLEQAEACSCFRATGRDAVWQVGMFGPARTCTHTLCRPTPPATASRPTAHGLLTQGRGPGFAEWRSRFCKIAAPDLGFRGFGRNGSSGILGAHMAPCFIIQICTRGGRPGRSLHLKPRNPDRGFITLFQTPPTGEFFFFFIIIVKSKEKQAKSYPWPKLDLGVGLRATASV